MASSEEKYESGITDNSPTAGSLKFDKEQLRICPSKLTKRELEDLFLNLLETNLELNNSLKEKQEKIKMLTTKINKMYSAIKSHEADERKNCCINAKQAFNRHQASLSDLRRTNERMAERIRLLNIKMAAINRQSGIRALQSNHSRCHTNCKPWRLNSSRSVSENKIITKSKDTQTESKANKDKVCDENKCQTQMKDFKQNIANLEDELASTHKEYSDRISRLESEVRKYRKEQRWERVHNDSDTKQVAQYDTDDDTSREAGTKQAETRKVAKTKSEAPLDPNVVADIVMQNLEKRLNNIEDFCIDKSYCKKRVSSASSRQCKYIPDNNIANYNDDSQHTHMSRQHPNEVDRSAKKRFNTKRKGTLNINEAVNTPDNRLKDVIEYRHLDNNKKDQDAIKKLRQFATKPDEIASSKAPHNIRLKNVHDRQISDNLCEDASPSNTIENKRRGKAASYDKRHKHMSGYKNSDTGKTVDMLNKNKSRGMFDEKSYLKQYVGSNLNDAQAKDIDDINERDDLLDNNRSKTQDRYINGNKHVIDHKEHSDKIELNKLTNMSSEIKWSELFVHTKLKDPLYKDICEDTSQVKKSEDVPGIQGVQIISDDSWYNDTNGRKESNVYKYTTAPKNELESTFARNALSILPIGPSLENVQDELNNICENSSEANKGDDTLNASKSASDNNGDENISDDGLSDKYRSSNVPVINKLKDLDDEINVNNVSDPNKLEVVLDIRREKSDIDLFDANIDKDLSDNNWLKYNETDHMCDNDRYKDILWQIIVSNTSVGSTWSILSNNTKNKCVHDTPKVHDICEVVSKSNENEETLDDIAKNDIKDLNGTYRHEDAQDINCNGLINGHEQRSTNDEVAPIQANDDNKFVNAVEKDSSGNMPIENRESEPPVTSKLPDIHYERNDYIQCECTYDDKSGKTANYKDDETMKQITDADEFNGTHDMTNVNNEKICPCFFNENWHAKASRDIRREHALDKLYVDKRNDLVNNNNRQTSDDYQEYDIQPTIPDNIHCTNKKCRPKSEDRRSEQTTDFIMCDDTNYTSKRKYDTDNDKYGGSGKKDTHEDKRKANATDKSKHKDESNFNRRSEDKQIYSKYHDDNVGQEIRFDVSRGNNKEEYTFDINNSEDTHNHDNYKPDVAIHTTRFRDSHNRFSDNKQIDTRKRHNLLDSNMFSDASTLVDQNNDCDLSEQNENEIKQTPLKINNTLRHNTDTFEELLSVVESCHKYIDNDMPNYNKYHDMNIAANDNNQYRDVYSNIQSDIRNGQFIEPDNGRIKEPAFLAIQNTREFLPDDSFKQIAEDKLPASALPKSVIESKIITNPVNLEDDSNIRTLSKLSPNELVELQNNEIVKRNDNQIFYQLFNGASISISSSEDNQENTEKNEPTDSINKTTLSKVGSAKHDQHNSLQIPGPIPTSSNNNQKGNNKKANRKYWKWGNKKKEKPIETCSRALPEEKVLETQRVINYTENNEVSKTDEIESFIKETDYSQKVAESKYKNSFDKEETDEKDLSGLVVNYSSKTELGQREEPIIADEKEIQVELQPEQTEKRKLSKDAEIPTSIQREVTTYRNSQGILCFKTRPTLEPFVCCPCNRPTIFERNKIIQAEKQTQIIERTDKFTVTDQLEPKFIVVTEKQVPKSQDLSPAPNENRTTEDNSQTVTKTEQGTNVMESSVKLQTIEIPSHVEGESTISKPVKAIRDDRRPSIEGPILEKVEGTLQILSEELARCKELLRSQQNRDNRNALIAEQHSGDLSILDEHPTHALRRGQAKHTIVEKNLPRCVFILHIGTIVLSDEALMSTQNKSLVLRWKFYNQNTSMTHMNARRVMLFDFSTEYDIQISYEFFDYMKREEMEIVICELNELREPFVKCALPLRDALLHTNRRFDMSLALVAGPRMKEARNAIQTSDKLDRGDETGVIDLWCMLRADSKILPIINRAIAPPTNQKKKLAISKETPGHDNGKFNSEIRTKKKPVEKKGQRSPLILDKESRDSHRPGRSTKSFEERDYDMTLPKTVPIDNGPRHSRVTDHLNHPPIHQEDRRKFLLKDGVPRGPIHSLTTQPDQTVNAQQKLVDKPHEAAEDESSQTSETLLYDPRKYPFNNRFGKIGSTNLDYEQPHLKPTQPSKENRDSLISHSQAGVYINEVIANIKTTEDMKRAMLNNSISSIHSVSRLPRTADDLISHAQGSLQSYINLREGRETRRLSGAKLSLQYLDTNKKRDSYHLPALMLPEEISEKSQAIARYEHISKLYGQNRRITINSNEPPQRDVPKNVVRDNESLSDDSYREEKLDITVLWLALNEECDAMLNPHIQRVYVAYTFLGKSGADLETPFSLPKPKHQVEKCYFNFKRSFYLRSEDLSLLGHMVRCRAHSSTPKEYKHCIIFSVVSEPPEDPLGLETCEDIGYAYLYLGDLLAYSTGSPTYTEVIPVTECGGSSICGVLAIKVDGLDVLRQCYVDTAADHIPTMG